jgi:DNA polymerase zeta
VFRVRLNCIDHYQSRPTRYDPQLRNDVRASQRSREPQVPVVRVFGSTETGQKVCAHIHGAFPYLYIDYKGPLDKASGEIYLYKSTSVKSLTYNIYLQSPQWASTYVASIRP